MLTHQRLREVLDYDPQTGIFTWRERTNKTWNTRYAHKQAGTISKWGYLIISIDDALYRANRLAWFFVHGRWLSNQVDHIDGNKTNDRLSNLREATPSQNHANRGHQQNNTSGYKGVSWSKRWRKWHAEIGMNGQRIHLGWFTCPKAAYQAYCEAATKHHGEFART